MTQQQNIAPGPGAGVSIGNATIPVEGPKALPVALDFTTNPSASVDPLQLYMQQTLTLIQGVYVDNSANTSPLLITVSATKQNVTVSPGDQGFYPLMSPKSGTINFFSLGQCVVDVSLYNVPLPASSWGAVASGGKYAASGALETDDINLQQIIDPLKGIKTQGGGGASALPDTVPFNAGWPGNGNDPFNLFGLMNNGNTYYLTNLFVGVTPDAYIQGAPQLIDYVVTPWDTGAQALFRGQLYIPGAAPAVASASRPAWGTEYSNPDGLILPIQNFPEGTGLRMVTWNGPYNTGRLPQLAAGEYVCWGTCAVVVPS